MNLYEQVKKELNIRSKRVNELVNVINSACTELEDLKSDIKILKEVLMSFERNRK